MEGTREEKDSNISKRSKTSRSTSKPIKKTSHLRNQAGKERTPQVSVISPRRCPHEENDEDDETSTKNDIQNECISKEGNYESNVNRKQQKRHKTSEMPSFNKTVSNAKVTNKNLSLEANSIPAKKQKTSTSLIAKKKAKQYILKSVLEKSNYKKSSNATKEKVNQRSVRSKVVLSKSAAKAKKVVTATRQKDTKAKSRRGKSNTTKSSKQKVKENMGKKSKNQKPATSKNAAMKKSKSKSSATVSKKKTSTKKAK